MPAQTNGLNQLPRELYGDGAAVMSTLNQIAGGIGTALAITLLMNGQTLHMEKFPNATPGELMAAGTKYTYVFIVGLSVVGLILSLFVKRVHVGKN